MKHHQEVKLCVPCVCVSLKVIRTLEPTQQQPLASPEVTALKNQLTEREKRLKHLEVTLVTRAGYRGSLRCNTGY